MEGRFPVLHSTMKSQRKGPKTIPWSVAEKAYETYDRKYGGPSGQSLERIAQRGGFAPEELDKFYPEWRQHINEQRGTTMNRTRLQQLAGIKPLFEQDNADMYMQWEDQMQQEFMEQNPHVTDNPEELEIEDDGQVYHRESNQRWPANTVTPFDDWQAEQQGNAADNAEYQMDQNR